MSSIMPCEIMNNSQIKPTTPIHLATTSGGGGRGQHPEFSRATELSSLYTMRIEATCLFYVFNRAHWIFILENRNAVCARIVPVAVSVSNSLSSVTALTILNVVLV